MERFDRLPSEAGLFMQVWADTFLTALEEALGGIEDNVAAIQAALTAAGIAQSTAEAAQATADAAQATAAAAQQSADTAAALADTALSGSTSASETYNNSLSGATYSSFSPQLTLDSSAGGSIRATLVGTYDNGGGAGTFRGEFKIEYSPAGAGTWTDFPGSEQFGSTASSGSDGYINIGSTATGLTPSTSYDVRASYRRAGGNPNSLGSDITLVAVPAA